MAVDELCANITGNEVVFRNILRDIVEHRHERTMGIHVEPTLDPKAPLERLLAYTERRYGKFTITRFERPEPTTALFGFHNLACMSGGGADYIYRVNPDNSVVFQKVDSIIRS